MRVHNILRSGPARKLLLVILTLILYFCGIFTLLFETNFQEYPLGEPVYDEIKRACFKYEKPNIKPFNTYDYPFKYSAVQKCSSEYKLRLVIIVKSALKNFEKRHAIRKSWGFGNRYSDVEMRTVFILGISDEKDQIKIDEENNQYNDIVQASFIDNYFNNTIKSIMAYKWAVTYCPDSKFYVFSDDDMYVSIKNILRFVRHPLGYPEYLEVPIVSLKESHHYEIKREIRDSMLDYELDDKAELYAGHVFPSSHPQRFYWSKWYISLNEYPFNKWPPYVTGGTYILSNIVLRQFYYASQVTKHFRFDDIYISMLAYKLNITPVHNDEFYFHQKNINSNYKYVIASHGFDDPHMLKEFWQHQKTIGNA